MAEFEDIKIDTSLSKNVNIPKGVTDLEAWNRYLKLQKDLDETPDRMVQTSDPKVIVDLCTSNYILGKMMAHLNVEERESIYNKANPFKAIIQKMNAEKRKAFGNVKAQSGLGVVGIKQAEILELFGKFYTASEVHKIITQDWGYEVNPSTLNAFRADNIDRIVELQEQFKMDHSNVRLGIKRSRLDELSYLYERTKDKYIKSESREDAKLMQSLLESVKREVDGDLVINGKFQVDIQQTIQMQIQQDLIKDFNITSLIMSRLAGRMGVNPELIISRLANSMYAKFIGFRAPEISREDDEIVYPSNVIYDITAIQEKNRLLMEAEEQKKSLPIIDDKAKLLSMKEKLIAKLEEDRRKLNESQNIINKGGR